MNSARIFKNILTSFFSISLLCACSKHKVAGTVDATTETPRQVGEGTTPEEGTILIRHVGYRPVIGANFRKTEMDLSLSCVQWVEHTNAGVKTEKIEFHHSACPNDGTPLLEQSLAFSVNLGKPEISEGGVETYTLTLPGETEPTPVGQLQHSTVGSRLEELCQFTNTTKDTAMYADKCAVEIAEKSWGALNLLPAVPRTVSLNGNGSEVEPSGNDFIGTDD